MDVPTIRKEEYEQMAAFRYALRVFLRFSEQAAEAVGLTPQQHQALLAIQGFPGRERVTVGELAERLQVRHQSAVGLVDRLAAQGLLKREPAEGDRRQVFVSLTGQGQDLLNRLTAAHRVELRRLRPGLQRLLELFVDR
jgi:DNA-binding MarR family transcriptional regulator